MEIFDTYSIPQWAVCYLEYGDFGDMSDEDERDANAFIESLPNGACFQWGEPEGFTAHPAFGLACDTVEMTVYVPTTED